MGLPKEILNGYNKRYKRDFGSNPSVHKVACPICKPKGIDGWIWRYTNGKWGRCTVCGFGGTIPA